ncbi:AAA family ATPase [Candidatus Phytoplasma ziziphi]|uniref:AAA family ATPase n=1 Tax=Ziziphus jujuba witches'-broom phytoplasma TaxID=135727 RepID=UPI001EDE2FFA|nr:AAA family ATPase [Candidatus Phytoplasma ziziphi]
MNWESQIFENPQGNRSTPPPLLPKKKKKLKYYLSIVQIIVNIIFYVVMIFFLYLGIRTMTNKNGDLLIDQDKKWAEDKIIKENHLTIENDFRSYEPVKQQMLELIQNIKDANKDIPRGFLLHGPPGTGKTYLANCLAGSLKQNASFYVVNGSEFVEKYVGVGAARIRKLFKTARETAMNKGQKYFFIFIDEIDSIGRKRSSEGSSSIETENSLNALLSEIDGFHSGDGKIKNSPYGIVFGSTNRKDLLDEALIREGRLGNHIYLGYPNHSDIKELLEYFFSKNKDKTFLPLSEDKITLSKFLSKTHFTAAQINSLIKEVKKLANEKDHKGKTIVTIDNFYDALDEVVLGPKNKVIESNSDKNRIIQHELGHAVVSKAFNFNVNRINVESRGDKGGYTLSFPKEDRNLLTRDDFLQKIIILFGGRAAESIFYKSVSIASSDDLQKAKIIASEMIDKFGMLNPEGLPNNENQKVIVKDKETIIFDIINKSYCTAQKIIENYNTDTYYKDTWKNLNSFFTEPHDQLKNKMNNEQFERSGLFYIWPNDQNLI